MKQNIILKSLALIACLLCSLRAAAYVDSYACYTPENTTLTFYFDNQRSSRTGTTYDLNEGDIEPYWFTDGTESSVTKGSLTPRSLMPARRPPSVGSMQWETLNPSLVCAT